VIRKSPSQLALANKLPRPSLTRQECRVVPLLLTIRGKSVFFLLIFRGSAFCDRKAE
jgi:hypothetical protein